jgi:protein gp37
MALSTAKSGQIPLNPVTGCTKISSGCSNCYAERLAFRLQSMGNPNYIKGFRVTLHEEMLELPLKWEKHKNIRKLYE